VNVETAALVNLSKLIEKKSLSYYSTSEWQPFEVYQESRRAEAEKNLKLLREGKLEGYGLALVNGDNDLLCGSEAEDKKVLTEIAAQTLLSFTEPKIREKKRLELKQGNAETIFVMAKRQQCGFVVGDAAYLKPIVTALERDGKKVTIAPLWLKQEKVDEILKAVATRAKEDGLKLNQRTEEQRQKEAAATRKLQEEREKVEQQEKLAAAKKAAEDKERGEDIKRMRKLVESRGQGLVDVMNGKVRNYLRNLKAAASVKNDLDDPVWSPFPQWASDRAKEKWEFGDTTASLEDYGLAKWKSKLIEALTVKIEIPMLNRLIGERQTACWQFTWINDDEFTMLRNILVVPCDEYAKAFKQWTDANLFKSQWKL
jgi:hypothetical protein